MSWESIDLFDENIGLKGFDWSFRNSLSANGTVSDIPFESLGSHTLPTEEVMVRTDLKRLFPVAIVLLKTKEAL